MANLFISDGSRLEHAGDRRIRTLTIVALALRQAEYIAREMSARHR